MGRPRKYVVNPDELSAVIQTAYEADVAEFQAQHGKDSYGHSSWAREARWELRRATEEGVKVDLERFARRCLTAGERMRHLEAIHALGESGLLTVYGERITRIRLTPEGVAHLISKEVT